MGNCFKNAYRWEFFSHLGRSSVNRSRSSGLVFSLNMQCVFLANFKAEQVGILYDNAPIV